VRIDYIDLITRIVAPAYKNKTGPVGCAGPVWFAADLEVAPA
jgi:hypothetical protein